MFSSPYKFDDPEPVSGKDNSKLTERTMRVGTSALKDPKNRRFFLVAVGLAVLSIALAPIHTISALLSLPFAGAVAYLFCDIISHAVTGRRFVFPSKWGLNTAEEHRLMAWSDHVLAFLFALLTVLGLFVFGEFVDCVRHEDVWRGGAAGISWCSDNPV